MTNLGLLTDNKPVKVMAETAAPLPAAYSDYLNSQDVFSTLACETATPTFGT